MDKIGIITIYDMTNYGNRLQNYAVYRSFINENVKAETLVCENKISNIQKIKRRLLNEIHALTLPKYPIEDLGYIRWCKFEKFTHKNIPTRIFYSDDIYLSSQINDDYIEFVAGSDQIWNYEFPGRFGDYTIHSKDYFLTFADKQKRNSLSASFGIEEIDEKWSQQYCTWLNDFKNLSVREKSGADLIYRLTGRNVKVLIDPTMYLTVDEWRKVASKPNKVSFSEPYLLEYFLSPISNKDDSNIQEITDRFHLKRYKLWDVSFENLFVIGPDEFLYLIDHAAVICTDSYHASAFSILFKKPFIVYPRGNMNSRIDTLLCTFGFENRISDKVLLRNIFKMDYTKCENELELKRKEYRAYIRTIIDGK